MTEELCGRFVRVPVEFIDRTLHPWMTSAAWREAYVRMQRNRSFVDHRRSMGQSEVWLKEGQLPISVRWLVETCPELTEKSARIFLEYIETPPDGSDPLIHYPGGKKRGARYQVITLLEHWTPTKSEVRDAKRARRANSRGDEGRTRKPRKRRRDKDSEQEGAAEGRTPDAGQGELEPGEASSAASGANSSTEIGGPFAAGANSYGNGKPDSTRGFGARRALEGRTPEGGGVGGEGERDEVETGPPSFFLPPAGGEGERERLEKRTADKLVRFAAAYCAPEGRAVPLRGRELTDLRGLVCDVHAADGTADAVRDFFVAARRWADSPEVSADRMNASFIRSNQGAIRKAVGQTRSQERARKHEARERERRRAEWEYSDAYAHWRVDAKADFDELGADQRQEYFGQADNEIEPPPIENELSLKARDLAVRGRALELFGHDRGQPPPTKPEES